MAVSRSVLGSNERNTEWEGGLRRNDSSDAMITAQTCTLTIMVTFQKTPVTKTMYHKRTRMIGTQKYLRKICYNCIECTEVTFLAAFMFRRPLNNAALVTTTHRKLKRVSDGTYTQVRAQIINKCKVKMAQKELYNARDPS